MNLKEIVVLSDEKPAVVQIKNTAKTQILAIGLRQNQVLKKHITSIPALLVVLEGKVLFEMEGSTAEIPSLSTIDIPANVFHEVTGLQESLFLVIKEKN
jgi:quercetin dioxygenase-like cupin family protein